MVFFISITIISDSNISLIMVFMTILPHFINIRQQIAVLILCVILLNVIVIATITIVIIVKVITKCSGGVVVMITGVNLSGLS